MNEEPNVIIRKAPTVLLLLSIFVVSNTFAQKQEKEYYRDESVAGARGAMGLLPMAILVLSLPRRLDLSHIR